MFSARLDDDIELRPFASRYAEELFALIEDNRDYLAHWFPWADKTKTSGDLAGFIKAGRQQLADENGFQAGIWLHGTLVGSVGLHYINGWAKATEVGYWLAQDKQGQGVMTRVLAGLCTLCFEDYDLNRIEIRCAENNRKSRAVPKRLGFKQEGVIRHMAYTKDGWVDFVIYGMLATDWQAK